MSAAAGGTLSSENGRFETMRQTFLNRRNALKTLAAFAGAAALPHSVQASLLSTLQRNRILAETDRDANSRIALDAISSNEPIISYDTEYNLQRVLTYYRTLVTQGGWPELPQSVHGRILGHTDDSVRILRTYLKYTGDLARSASDSDVFDSEVDAAVRGFQARHGLKISGQVDEFTYWTMNVPAATRLNQLELNMERIRGLADMLEDRYVVVNIPAATIEAVQGKIVDQRHTAIVGRIDRQTPILESQIHQINFNPYWHVPTSIIRRDITKYMMEDPNYLANQHIKVIDSSGNTVDPSTIDWTTDEAVNYRLRQEPGAGNAMGHVKINFHNPYSVYLHDTPQQSLFGEIQRFESSGCVRVENVADLVTWILRDNGYDIIDVNAAFASGEREDVSVENPPQILTTYMTAWANQNAVVSFRDDIYEFDSAGKVAFENLSA